MSSIVINYHGFMVELPILTHFAVALLPLCAVLLAEFTGFAAASSGWSHKGLFANSSIPHPLLSRHRHHKSVWLVQSLYLCSQFAIQRRRIPPPLPEGLDLQWSVLAQ
jgi:hypothetical protein